MPPLRIVILRADHLGDMILTTPLVRALGKAGHEVTVVGPRAWAAVWEGNPWARYAALEEACPQWPRHWFRLAGWLYRNGFDHLLVPYYEPRLFLASFFSGIRHRACQMGRYLGRLTLHTALRTHLETQPRHMTEVWLDYARHLGIQPASAAPELFLADDEKAAVQAMLDQQLPDPEPLVVIHPFHKGSTCHPPLETYVAVARQLLGRGRCRIAITGTAGDLSSWQTAAGDLIHPRLWLAIGALSLRQLFAVIAQARVLVAGSTGPLHIASALGVPSVSPFCPHPAVSPQLWGNLTPGSCAVEAAENLCARRCGQDPAGCGALSDIQPGTLGAKVERLLC
ncbi:MAG: hypothetical protein QOE70_987 [Chthoniobacter sp.]|jgi:ADP-heptose:LPS heptosyltransferase|nr:hypothetical protein [Chthoniobacter sp.]